MSLRNGFLLIEVVIYLALCSLSIAVLTKTLLYTHHWYSVTMRSLRTSLLQNHARLISDKDCFCATTVDKNATSLVCGGMHFDEHWRIELWQVCYEEKQNIVYRKSGRRWASLCTGKWW